MTANARPTNLAQCRTPEEAFGVLTDWFFEERLSIEGGLLVSPESLPAAARHLLVHHEHMTVRLCEYHDRPMRLQVLHERHEGDVYRRCIHLVPEGVARVVEFGIVRIDLTATSAAVRQAILERHRPLGDILVNSRMLRRIEPRWYFVFPADAPMTDHFGDAHRGPVYGRLGTIHCEGQPAIDLLEVVTLERLANLRPTLPQSRHGETSP